MLHTVNGKWPKPTALAEYDPITCQVQGFSEVQRRQEHLNEMTGEAEVLRPLVESCLHNDPVKRPSMLVVSESIKPLKVCLCHSEGNVNSYIIKSLQLLAGYSNRTVR